MEQKTTTEVQPVIWSDADGRQRTACTRCNFSSFYYVPARKHPHLCLDCEDAVVRFGP